MLGKRYEVVTCPSCHSSDLIGPEPAGFYFCQACQGPGFTYEEAILEQRPSKPSPNISVDEREFSLKLSTASARELIGMEPQLSNIKVLLRQKNLDGKADFVSDILFDIQSIQRKLEDIRYKADMCRPTWREMEKNES